MTKSKNVFVRIGNAFTYVNLTFAGLTTLTLFPATLALLPAASAQQTQERDLYTTSSPTALQFGAPSFTAPPLLLASVSEPYSSSAAALPDSPDATLDGIPGQSGQGAKTTPAAPPPDTPSKRIFYIVPNFRSVGVGAKLPPQTVWGKFRTAEQDTIDPSAFALAALLATYNYVTTATPEFQRGGVAFGRYYWHAYTDQAIENTVVEFLVPSITHEDTRYYTLGTGGFKKRLVYSLTRVVVTRSDSGHETFNASEVLGAGIASGISSRYYPPSQRDAGSVLKQYALDLGIDAASYVLREFDSDVTHVLSRHHDQVPATSTP